jgi:hypothetical protein
MSASEKVVFSIPSARQRDMTAILEAMPARKRGREKTRHSRRDIQRDWTTAELSRLRELAAESFGIEAIAELLERSVDSVRSAASRNRISLRRKGITAGILLGQPRGTSFRRPTVEELAELRDDVLAGRIDLPSLERVVLAKAEPEAELCPSCVARPQEVASTGLCTQCHLKRLAEAHREVREPSPAQRELWRERQRKSRRRRRGGNS